MPIEAGILANAVGGLARYEIALDAACVGALLDLVVTRQRVGIGRLRDLDAPMFAQQRERDRDGAQLDIERGMMRRWQDGRPVGAGNGQPDTVAGRKTVAAGIQCHPDVSGFTRDHRLRLCVGMPVRQVQYAEADAGRGAVRVNIDDADAQIGQWCVAGQANRELRLTEHDQFRVERLAVESDRAGIIDALIEGDPLLGRNFLDFAWNSIFVATIAALLATMLALLLSYGERLHPTRFNRVSIRFATLGYALPGAMIAIGILTLSTSIDRAFGDFAEAQFGFSPGLILTGSIAGLVFAYVARFLTAAYNATHSGLEKVHPTLDAAARILGAGPRRVLAAIHVPLMRGALASAALIVFIDVLKELPATLLLRPFNFETLATRTYRLASDERLAEASTAALMIVALGLLPAILLSFSISKGSTPPPLPVPPTEK